ncbi:MAG: FAD:protein FMN transferase [Spirochaetia bacterium]|nr:FAD:protein FMN transferase [Spirochaetia bacterium]
MFKNKKIILPVIIAVTGMMYFLFLYAPMRRSCSFYSMGGILTEIQGYATDKKTMDKACSRIQIFFEDIENEISNYRDNSFISGINRQENKREVKLPVHTYKMVKESIRVSENTLGYYDITVLPILDVWKNAQKQNRLPSSDTINRALEKVSYKKIALNDDTHTVFFKTGAMELDLGAIAKGYMGDESQKIMEKLGIKRGLINCGGGVVVFDRNEIPKPFVINIYNPDKRSYDQKSHTGIGQNTISLTNGSVQTSGNYNRFYTIDGKKYSHIVDPHTGLPSGKCHSITVKSTVEDRSGAIADAYGTGFCAMIAAGKNPEDLHLSEVEIIQLKR